MKRAIAAVILTAELALPAELPVRQVVLYKHGAGFFEREGRLAPGESARLDFDAAEMNDVLKSLTVEERGGGKITGLRYDSQDPLSRKLAGFPFQVAEDQSMAAMLGKLAGARLELRLGMETVSGAIVTGRISAATDKQPERQLLTLLLDSGELMTADLNSATGLRFTDARLQQQFKEYLAALAAARATGKRSMYIDSTDARERDVRAGYMIPAAIWKSSYRLIFNTAGDPVIEGWAIVDNTTGDDWNKVTLSLVSGRPISFVSQLYAPKYVTRPAIELADDGAARPVVHEGGFVAGSGGFAPPLAKAEFAPAPPNPQAQAARRPFAVQMPAATAAADTAAAMAMSSVAPGAAAQELGELFEYRIAQPVTIKRNESAMLPFLQQEIHGRKLLIYSDHSSRHPTNAALLTNSTGKTLDGGPVTVYDGGAYGGEALMETLKAGDQRLISYAVDLGTRITEAFGSSAEVVREIHASRGMLTTRLAAEEKRTYTIRNVDPKAKALIIEHPVRAGYVLLNQKPAEKTPANYRFEIALAAGDTKEFPVAEERVYEQTHAVTSLTPDALLAYVRNRNLSDAARSQLQAIAGQKARLAENGRLLAELEAQVGDIHSDEQRIRQNISSLNVVSGQQQQVQNYARELERHEQQLAVLRGRQAELQKSKSALESELSRLIEELSF